MMMRASPEMSMIYGNVSTDPYENMTTEQVSSIVREQIRQNQRQTNQFVSDILLILYTIVSVYILIHIMLFIIY
jgi:hypothetical protein